MDWLQANPEEEMSERDAVAFCRGCSPGIGFYSRDELQEHLVAFHPGNADPVYMLRKQIERQNEILERIAKAIEASK